MYGTWRFYRLNGDHGLTYVSCLSSTVSFPGAFSTSGQREEGSFISPNGKVMGVILLQTQFVRLVAFSLMRSQGREYQNRGTLPFAPRGYFNQAGTMPL